MKKIIIGIFALVLLAQAEEMLFTKGQMIYNKYGCYGCHGSNAEGNGDYPRLASKKKAYLIKRLKGYRDGTITSNRANIMRPYAKKLSDKDIEALAEFLSKKIYMNEQPDEKYYEEFLVGDSSGS